MIVPSRCIVALALTILLVLPATSAEVFEPLKISAGDEPLPAACSAPEKQKLRSTVVQLAEQRAALQAWQLVEHALCSPRSIGEHYVYRHMSKLIKSTKYYSGDESETSRLIEGTPDFMPEGRAWGVSAQAIGRQISIIFWSAEVCVSDFTIAQRGKFWLIVGTGLACD